MAGKKEHDREAILAKILPRLADGEPLSVICRDIGFERRTVNKWREEDPEIDARMQAAKDDGYDVIAQRTRATARGEHRKGKDSATSVMRDKLTVETDLKLLAKWDPKRYGDKMEHSGPNGGPIPLASTSVTFAAKDPTEAAAIYQKVMAGEG
ncbi:hypothetical protein FHW84_001818 [Dyella sp. SG562]|uniref:helix-turn-helix domain-containing protein n=1 Tax=Dyella sp. SG562 TaxID=2587017 RepID=UPI001421FB64|nr:helix-turn-helix domain-containing protein [Dyella sp. SG562]NII73249.1 hypothetical protein [Dyella sp. SG562]